MIDCVRLSLKYFNFWCDYRWYFFKFQIINVHCWNIGKNLLLYMNLVSCDLAGLPYLFQVDLFLQIIWGFLHKIYHLWVETVLFLHFICLFFLFNSLIFFLLNWTMFGTFSAAHSNPHIFPSQSIDLPTGSIQPRCHISPSYLAPLISPFQMPQLSNFHWQCCLQQPKGSVVLFSFPDTMTTLQSFTHLSDHRTANWNVNSQVLHRKKFRH